MQLFLLVALGIATGCMAIGWEYYFSANPGAHRLHESWRPAGAIGHRLGWIGTAILLTNFLYLVRKRVRGGWFLGSVAFWLDVHVFVGLTGAMLVLYHSAFRTQNIVAMTSLVCLGLLVATGIVGRYVLAQVPQELAVLRERANLLAAHLREILPEDQWRSLQTEQNRLTANVRPVQSVRAALAMLPKRAVRDLANTPEDTPRGAFMQ